MMAALSASENSENRITLIERQARVGRKLLSTGNGRCNLSNTGASESNYHGENTKFVVPALRAFTPERELEYFASLGLLTVEEYGGRVYPLSNQANSVLDVLRFALERAGVELISGAAVTAVKRTKSGFKVVWQEGERRCDKLIVACGGCAGSKLGGVMDGYELLKSLGHSRTSLYPALTQVRTDNTYPRSLKGVRAEGKVSVYKKGRLFAENCGELLFTETGVSGIAVFEISRAVSTNGEGLELRLDFFRHMEQKEILAYLTKRQKALPDMAANQILTGTVHNKLGQMLCKYAGIGGEQLSSQLEIAQLEALSLACKDFRLKVTGVSGFESAQVTAGGIKTSEFDANTLQSRIVPGLYACGEVLDVDGDCGGYNLHWAWASGRLAGRLGK